MKLLRDSFDWRVLRRRLFVVRRHAERTYTVTVPAPRPAAVRPGERAAPTSTTLSGLG